MERSRTITISATILRRPVNAFNHLHQLRLLGIEGDQGADQHVEAMDKNQLMQIFKIGPTEALAAKNLAFHTTPYMTSTLARLVGDFGMHNRWGPVHHAALASELLCTGRGPPRIQCSVDEGNYEHSRHPQPHGRPHRQELARRAQGLPQDDDSGGVTIRIAPQTF